MTVINPAAQASSAPLCCRCPEAPRTTREANGDVTFENENYRITTTDDGTVMVFNKNTCESYRIWGDPHVNVDGQHAFDFWGRTTFVLDDGTKITIQTVPWEGNPNMTVASTVTISDGDYGVHLTGVDPNGRGDLCFREGNGYLMDAFVRDGNSIYENLCGAGFVAIDECGNIVEVDQAWINRTDESKVNDLLDAAAKMLLTYAGLVSLSFVGSFLMGLLQGLAVGDDTGNSNDVFLTVARSRTGAD